MQNYGIHVENFKRIKKPQPQNFFSNNELDDLTLTCNRKEILPTAALFLRKFFATLTQPAQKACAGFRSNFFQDGFAEFISLNLTMMGLLVRQNQRESVSGQT